MPDQKRSVRVQAHILTALRYPDDGKYPPDRMIISPQHVIGLDVQAKATGEIRHPRGNPLLSGHP